MVKRRCGMTHDYWVPPPPHDSLMRPLPALVPSASETQVKPLYDHYDDTVFLLAGLVSLFIKEDISPPKDSDLIFDTALYFTNQKRWVPTFKSERCYVPRNLEIELGTSTPDDSVIATGLASCRDYKPVRLPQLPSHPQPPPPPLPNVHLYEEFRIPRILRRMSAKTREGQRRFHEWRDSVFQQRKALFAAGEQLLREAEFQGDHVDRRAYCVQCGASFFERKSGKLRCRDCRWELSEVTYFDQQDRFDSPVINDRFGITTSNEGQRETNALRQSDHQERKVWFPKWQARFNPTGKKWADVTTADVGAVMTNPDFSTEVARYQVMFTGTRTNEVAEGLPNTLTKRFTRARADFDELTTPEEYAALCEVFGDNKDVLSLAHAQGGFDLVVAVELNSRIEWKPLGKSTDSEVKLRRALIKHRKDTEKARLKSLQRKARANGWTEEMLAVEIQYAKERIGVAYGLPLEAFGQGEGTVVTFSRI